MLLLLLQLTASLAQQEVGRTQVLSEAPPFDAYEFTIPTCDGVRARVTDDRPADRIRDDEAIFVTITNGSPELCLYRGVILKGSFVGAYTTSRLRQDGGAGFFVPPGESVRIQIKPEDRALATEEVVLEIAPGRATLLLRGAGRPASAPPPTAAPEATLPDEPPPVPPTITR